MLACVSSVVLVGADPRPVNVEVFVGGGQPKFQLVGLPDAAVREAKERVRAAIQSSGFSFPGRRVVVNLAPADVPKGGSAYDLPIALGVLVASKAVPADCARVVALGELALDGSVRAVRGGLGAAVVASKAGIRCLLPVGSAVEATSVGDATITAVRSLQQAVDVGAGVAEGSPLPPLLPVTHSYGQLSEVRGQATARRALEIAAAGGHHLLMSGPPGGGSTMPPRHRAQIGGRRCKRSCADLGRSRPLASRPRSGAVSLTTPLRIAGCAHRRWFRDTSAGGDCTRTPWDALSR